MAWLGREYSRETLRFAQAVRMAGVKKDDWESWQRDVEMITGVPRNG